MKSRTVDSWIIEDELQVVAKRNARERKRVEAVNDAFTRLRRLVALDNRGKRVSKVKTLQKAIEYISHLQDVLHLVETKAVYCKVCTVQ